METALATKQQVTRIAAIKMYFKDATLGDIKALTNEDKDELAALIAQELDLEIIQQ